MSGLRILVVDDDALNLRIAARLLRSLGHSGALVTDGEKGLRLVSSQPFDLMLLDINMPGISGEETLRRLRRQESAAGAARLPVLMISGYADDETRSHLLRLGADGLLTKPLAADTLASALSRLVHG